ncbi:MAG TPA: replicative DNA helicase [Treponemataceae bacterium]|nr:replicative DNA helicase [Treponemataceae bacterium]
MSSFSLKDKVPPHNLEAEQATLGALLLDWEAVGTVIRYLRPDRFYSLQNQKVFTAILSLFNKGQRGDILTIIEELRAVGDLDSSGGASYITSLTDTVPTSANVEYYAKIVLDQAVRRDLLKLSANMVMQSHDETINSRAVLEEAQKEIFNLTDSNSSQTIKTTPELINRAIEMIDNLYKNKTAITGVETGYFELDRMTSGFQPSELIILGARPSIGKTAMALSMAQNIAITKKIPTAFFSLEMSDMQLIQRLLVQEARIRSEYLRTGRLTLDDFQKLQNAAGRIYEAPLYIVDTPNMKLLDLRALARRIKAQHNVQIIFIDYITLITSENASIPRHEQIAEISRSLKSLARELQIPVVVLSQVRRDSEGKQPSLADLRESGSIEQDADVVMFLHRERTSASSEDQKNLTIDTQLILAKQRNGPTGIIDLVFIPQYTKFENAAQNSSQ